MATETVGTAGQMRKERPRSLWIIAMIVGLALAGGMFAYWKVNLSPVGCRQSRLVGLAASPETPDTYREDPSSCAASFSNIFKSVDLVGRGGSVYDIKLVDKNVKPVVVPDVDLRVFMPRVPPIASGDQFLTLLALQQREINRNDTSFPGITKTGDDVNVSNNCLRQGLWEAYITRNTGNDKGKYYHCWFEFPVPLYKDLFKSVNGFDLSSSLEPYLEHYLRLDGQVVNLKHLRDVVSESETPLEQIDRHLSEPIGYFGEQQHKAKLVTTPGLERYSDIYNASRQPVKLMQFAEPGRYSASHLMQFDYTFLGKPNRVVWRKAKNDRLDDSFNELEISFDAEPKQVWVKNWPFFRQRDGLHLILGGWKLADIPVASEQPIPTGDFKHFTFGIGTPTVYATYSYRLKEFSQPSNVYLLLVDKDGRYVDNHTLGLDQVYLSRLPDGSMVLYLVSYERIMLVAHWNLKPPQKVVAKATSTALGG